MRPHPAAAIERDSRIAFAWLIRELDLRKYGTDGPSQSVNGTACLPVPRSRKNYDAGSGGSEMVATDKLGRTWNDFLRLSRGERREFLVMLRDWHLQRRIEAVASRGGNYPYRGPRTFADLTLDGADLEPPAKPSLTDADLASLGLAE